MMPMSGPVVVLLRRVLVLLVAGVATVVVTQGPSHGACECKQKLSLEQKVNQASDVFSGTVTMASGPTTNGKTQKMSYDVKVDRVYKGDQSNSPRVTVKAYVTADECALSNLVADNRYLFFVQANGANLLATRCGGTQPARSAETQKLIALLGAGETPQPPSPEKATFTPVADADPIPLTRMAAPGAALLLVGLLGLMVFGALGRSKRSS